MTVDELIKELNLLPKDLLVIINTNPLGIIWQITKDKIDGQDVALIDLYG